MFHPHVAHACATFHGFPTAPSPTTRGASEPRFRVRRFGPLSQPFGPKPGMGQVPGSRTKHKQTYVVVEREHAAGTLSRKPRWGNRRPREVCTAPSRGAPRYMGRKSGSERSSVHPNSKDGQAPTGKTNGQRGSPLCDHVTCNPQRGSTSPLHEACITPSGGVSQHAGRESGSESSSTSPSPSNGQTLTGQTSRCCGPPPSDRAA